MRIRTPAAVLGVGLSAGLAWAAVSANYILDPVVIDDGGEIATSSNYNLQGSINGTGFAADIAGGNQNGTASSTNYVTVVGFPEVSGGGSGGSASGALVSTGNNNPGASNELATTTASIPMLQFVVSAGAGSGGITINSMTVSASGTGADQTDVNRVDIYTDLNANGVVDGSDAAVAGSAAFGSDNGTALFTPSGGIGIPAGSSATYLVVYTFNGTASPGNTFIASIAVGGMNITDGSAQPVTPGGLPVAGGTKTMVASGTAGTLTFATGPANPGGAPIAANTTAAPWLQFTASASSVESVTINSIRFTASGTLNDVSHITAVRLYLDAGSLPGAADAGDTLLGAGTYSGNDGTITFSSLGQSVTAGGSLTFLVTYDVAPSATAGGSAACTIVAGADVATTGGTSGGGATIGGVPVGAVRTIQVALPTTVTSGGGGGGGCAALAPGTVLPATQPLGVVLPWLLGLLALVCLRRRTA